MEGWCLDCDYFWSNLSGLRYAFVGGRVYYGVDCGPFYVNVDHPPAYAYYGLGACIVITTMAIFLVTVVLLSEVHATAVMNVVRSIFMP